MPEETVRGRSLEEIREVWANKLGLEPSALQLETVEKPGFFSRQWKVRVIWEDSGLKSLSGLGQEETGRLDSDPVETTVSTEAAEAAEAEDGARDAEDYPRDLARVTWDDGLYRIACPKGVENVIPFIRRGTLLHLGVEKEAPFTVGAGEEVEFYPFAEPGQLTWQIDVRYQGLTAVAKVVKKQPGKFALPDTIVYGKTLSIEECTRWEESPRSGEYWDKERLTHDLEELHIVYGMRPEAWAEIEAAGDGAEVILAQATMPIQGQPPRLEEFLGEGEGEGQVAETEKSRIDFFASKILLVQEGAVLARKIPGVPGEPGTDIYGRTILAEPWKDFQFRLKRNVRLSEDGLTVLAACAGRPEKFEEHTYGVDNVYVLNQDVNLATGSIEFPGDVVINGNVEDGLRIVAGGKVEISGGVSHAEIRAEKGLTIRRPVYGGKITVGEKYVVRSEILRRLKELQDELTPCLHQAAELAASPGAVRLKPGQCLKLILERNFTQLPKTVTETEAYIMGHRDELVTQEVVVSVKTAKHFLSGLGPLDLQSVPFLQKVEQVLANTVANIAFEVPEQLKCNIEYLQGTTVACGGDFVCGKGTYNSQIQVDGNIEIEGVCRGGKIWAGGNVSIRELGGSEVTSTLVQITGNKKLKVLYCHPNVLVMVNKETIRIEEACKNLEVFREGGRVQVEKLRANPL